MRLKTKVIVLCVLGVAVVGVGEVVRRRSTATSTAESPPNAPDLESAAGGRAVLNRVWFDRLPASTKEDETMWIFLAGGLAVQMSGSEYRWTTELFDLERAKDRLELSTLQDDKTIRLTFTVEACEEKPPFNLCLRLSEPLRGNQVLYGFGSEEEAANHLGWFRALRTRAHAAADSVAATGR